MAIRMDDTFIDGVVNQLQQLITTIPTTVSGSALTWDNLAVSAGSGNFPAGAALKTQVKTTGATIGTRLSKQGQILHNLSSGLLDWRESSDHAESLNEATAASLATYTGDLGGSSAPSITTTTS